MSRQLHRTQPLNERRSDHDQKGKLVVRINNVAGAEMTLCWFALFAPVTGLGCYVWSPRSPCPSSPLGYVDLGTIVELVHFDMATERSLAALLRSLQSTSSFEDASRYVTIYLLHGNHRRRLMMLSLS
jgi:hypothetical protein